MHTQDTVFPFGYLPNVCDPAIGFDVTVLWDAAPYNGAPEESTHRITELLPAGFVIETEDGEEWEFSKRGDAYVEVNGLAHATNVNR